MILGEKLEKAIADAKLSIEAVAAHADISVATLRRLFKKDSIDTAHLIKISEYVGKPLSYFLTQLAEGEKSGNISFNGMINTLGKIKKQSVNTTPANSEAESIMLQIDNDKAQQTIESLNDKIKSLEKEVALKDQIINLKDQIIEQFKK